MMINTNVENGNSDGGCVGGSDNHSGERAEAAVDRTMSFTRLYQPHQHIDTKEYPAMETMVLAYQSLGVVYGDLATSPVNTFSSTRLNNLSEEDPLGTLSLIIWTLTFLVLIKYVFIVLQADDYESNMEYSNVSTRIKKFLERSLTAQNFVTVLVLLGTCMVIGDGALTPATCVLSALEGIQSRSSKIIQEHVVWLSVVLSVALFAFQRCGTGKVGFTFSPIMLMWFATNVSIGVYNIITYEPSILKAASPHYILKFFVRNGNTAFDLLGAVFLSITGAEAMFADLGHFNKRAIQWGFSFVVYPSLILTYAGETAYLTKNPQKITDAYYSSIPENVYWPMFVISTLAAVVSSQSMISATFSIVKQSLSLDCFPRVNIIHTSSKHQGQVYSPEINYILMILTLGLVVGFKGGVELAIAYGVVVIWVMIIMTFLTTLVMLVVWKTNIVLVMSFFLPYMLKIPQGGWVPFVISAFFLTVVLSWRYGRIKKTTYEAERKMSIEELDQMLSLNSNINRTQGICFFFTDLVYGIPPIVRHYIQHTNSVREIMVIMTLKILPIKTVQTEDRFNVGKLGNEGVYRCLVRFGYKDSRNMKEDEYVASVLTKLQELTNITRNEEHRIQTAAEKEIVYVVGRTILKANKEKGTLERLTIDYLYRFLQKNSRAAVSTLEIPPERTLQIGMTYEI
ncbi:hypothetical protein ABFS83_06G024900 [Erythranthe nasuta]